MCPPQEVFGAFQKYPYIPRAELATRSISTVFRASGLCLAFSFLLVASTWKTGKRLSDLGVEEESVTEEITTCEHICNPSTQGLRQEDCCEFNASLGNLA